MMGVVLWSDPVDQKAVFWCEDHGDLAYYDASHGKFDADVVLNAGDMVSFMVTLERRVRRAHSAHVVETKVCDGLHDQLRKTAGEKTQPKRAHHAANIVEFMPRVAQR